MAFYQTPDFIDVSLKTWVSTRWNWYNYERLVSYLFWKWATNMPYVNWLKSCN